MICFVFQKLFHKLTLQIFYPFKIYIGVNRKAINRVGITLLILLIMASFVVKGVSLQIKDIIASKDIRKMKAVASMINQQIVGSGFPDQVKALQDLNNAIEELEKNYPLFMKKRGV